ncbi:PREDICTED: zinc finger BED domain-containing protein 1-like [Rhagoletis zephyria]|uniref:zinc finger BED domain-containing protein 1-like n=1 Tax=Rhagoletis zephyria TaxID=28612 RepID=UPI000811885C|nr:PREDICTED: zinc finger BED domain-containing protein 1-like [Rhagoletis zephyria]
MTTTSTMISDDSDDGTDSEGSENSKGNKGIDVNNGSERSRGNDVKSLVYARAHSNTHTHSCQGIPRVLKVTMQKKNNDKKGTTPGHYNSEDSGFREFVKVLDPRYTLPSRKTLQNVHMSGMYNDMKAKLFAILDSVESCAITTDCWTSRANEAYITVTCHFVSAVLATKPLQDNSNHSAQNIAASLRVVFDEWNIFSKISAITTDNASSMIKTCELLQKKHLPCFAHTINLVVQDCLALDCLKDILRKCKRIVTYFKSSAIALSKFKAEQQTEQKYSLIQEVPTRWNSAFYMIERIILTNDAIVKVLLSTSKAPPPLTADQIALLKELMLLLAPFDSATRQISSCVSITISLIIPIVCGLLHNLDNVKIKVKSPEGIEIHKFLVERVIKRLMPYEERTFPRIGTLLDRRFKKQGFRSPFNANHGLKILENELAAKKKIDTVPSEPPTLKETSVPSGQKLFEFLQTNIANMGRTDRVDAILELRQYMLAAHSPQDTNPLEFWKQKGFYAFQPLRPSRRECLAKLG